MEHGVYLFTTKSKSAALCIFLNCSLEPQAIWLIVYEVTYPEGGYDIDSMTDLDH